VSNNAQNKDLKEKLQAIKGNSKPISEQDRKKAEKDYEKYKVSLFGIFVLIEIGIMEET
jgi:hypothetical protein